MKIPTLENYYENVKNELILHFVYIILTWAYNSKEFGLVVCLWIRIFKYYFKFELICLHFHYINCK